MTRTHLVPLSLLCLTLGSAGCSQRQEGTAPPPAPQPPAAQQPPTQQALAKTLECSLSAPAQLKVGEPVPVQLRLTNPTAQPLSVLTWRTPLEGLLGDDFQVTRDGAEVPYEGPMVKRGEPQAADYTSLAPGKSVEATVDLSKGYALQQPGRYRIAYRGPLMDVATAEQKLPRPLAELQPLPVQCPVVEVVLAAP